MVQRPLRLVGNGIWQDSVFVKKRPEFVPSYDLGQKVRIKKTGQICTIKAKTDWGDYTLQEVEGCFPAGALEAYVG